MKSQRFLPGFFSIFGVAALSYIAGAVVMFLDLPSSEALGKAVLAARLLYDSARSTELVPTSAQPAIDRPDRTYDGYTLYAGIQTPKTGIEALLINMRREVVHRWRSPIRHTVSRLNGEPASLPDTACFFVCHLYPNGDLLAIYQGINCLAKLDKDSNLIWSYPGAVHHDLDIAADGTIYTLQAGNLSQMPEGLEAIPAPCKVDYLIQLSPDGNLVREPISILHALHESPYADLLDAVKQPETHHVAMAESSAPRVDYRFMVGDPLHTNSVRVLNKDMAARFPLFKAGDVLLSIRNLSVLAVIDPEARRVVWAARGPWNAQHDASFLENGHLLFYDNLGSPQGSRVLEYDPQTQALPWSYAGRKEAPFYSSKRGMCERLPNGNTLVVNSEGGQVLEISQEQEVVWSFSTDRFINTARRYTSDQLPFLKGDCSPR